MAVAIRPSLVSSLTSPLHLVGRIVLADAGFLAGDDVVAAGAIVDDELDAHELWCRRSRR